MRTVLSYGTANTDLITLKEFYTEDAEKAEGPLILVSLQEFTLPGYIANNSDNEAHIGVFGIITSRTYDQGKAVDAFDHITFDPDTYEKIKGLLVMSGAGQNSWYICELNHSPPL